MENNHSEKRDLIVAIIFSAFALLAFDLLFPSKPETQIASQSTQQEEVIATAQGVSPEALLNVQQDNAHKTLSRKDAVNESKHIAIKTPSLNGSLRLKGARFNNLLLSKYKETLEPDSKDVALLSPTGTDYPFFAEFGWISNTPMVLPNAETPWQTEQTELTPKTPVTLTWDNENGLKFIRQISVDDNYMFTVSDRVENYSKNNFTLFNYGLVARTNVPEVRRGAALEGMVGFLDDSLKEFAYSKMVKEKEASYKTTGGWAGITDKYWMAILAFDQKAPNVNVKFTESETTNGQHFQADYMMPPTVLGAGKAIQTSVHLFAGAKEIKLIDAYQDALGIERFDLTVDFGWYYFLTKPFLFILSWLYGLFGNMGLAILFFAFALRLVMFPIANKSFESMAKMKDLQPEIEKLRERFGEDKMSFNQEVMLLYKKNNVNPSAGCLPMLIQIPVFFSLYKVLYISLELRHAPFYGWIRDLSAPDPSSFFTLFGLINWPVPQAIDIGFWPIMMGLTMWLQQQMNPKAGDKTQNRILSFMPIMMTFLLGKLASGLVIYWTWSNLLSMAQQYALRFKDKKRKS